MFKKILFTLFYLPALFAISPIKPSMVSKDYSKNFNFASDELLSILVSREGRLYALETAISLDFGNSWSKPTTLTTNSFSIQNPQVALSHSTAIAIWKNFDSHSTNAFVCSSLDEGKSWSSPINLSNCNFSESIATPQIALDDQKAVAIWQKNSGSSNFLEATYSFNGGSNWSYPPAKISSSGLIEDPQITLSELQSIALWKKDVNSHWVIQTASSKDGGRSWSPSLDLSLQDANSSSPYLAQIENNALAIWTTFNGTSDTVMLASTNNGGYSWEKPQNLSEIGKNASFPHVTLSKSSAIAVWTLFDGKNNIVQASFSSDNGIHWSSSVTISQAGQNCLNPQVAITDKRGVAAWTIIKDGNQIIQLATTLDGGFSWSPPVNYYEIDPSCGAFQVALNWNGNEKFQFNPLKESLVLPKNLGERVKNLPIRKNLSR